MAQHYTVNDQDTVAQIAIAYVSNHTVQIDDLPRLMSKIRLGLTDHTDTDEAADEFDTTPYPRSSPLGWKGVKEPRKLTSKEIERSITPNEIICFENDRGYKSMKRGLATLGLTVDEYRAKWGLPRDYPMVAPNYAAARSNLAKELGLGQRR
jgi:predicted transcriptional regulator